MATDKKKGSESGEILGLKCGAEVKDSDHQSISRGASQAPMSGSLTMPGDA